MSASGESPEAAPACGGVECEGGGEESSYKTRVKFASLGASVTEAAHPADCPYSCCSNAADGASVDAAFEDEFTAEAHSTENIARAPPSVPDGALELVAKLTDEGANNNLVAEYHLVFDAMQTEPAFDKLFLAHGGTIASAQARKETDFAVTGSTRAVVRQLGDEFSTSVSIPISPLHIRKAEGQTNTVIMEARSKLLVCASRGGAAINGTLTNTVSGQGAVYMRGLLKSTPANAAIPLMYAGWRAHSAVVSTSGARIVDSHGRQQAVRFESSEARERALTAAETYLSAYGDGAWELRKKIVYDEAPTLTKAVSKQTVGINDSGYDFAHNVLMQAAPYSMETINSLFENTIKTELNFDENDMNNFEVSTAVPGKAAAAAGRTVAAALSTIANLLVSYRADGRTMLGPDGAKAVAAESWLRQSPRTPTEANDCDGSGICIVSLYRAVKNSSMQDRKQHKYINAAFNALNPHYQVGIAVVGASAAAASEDLSGDKTKSLAGHATAVLVPTLSLLRALDKGSARTYDKTNSGVLESFVPDDVRVPLAEARLNAFYTPNVIASLPEDERLELSTWITAKSALLELPTFATEGTTPASPVLYVEGDKYTAATATAVADKIAFSKIGATIGRSIKLLYVGGPDKKSPHRFYHDIVEISMPRDTPLWTNSNVRELGFACTQVVLSSDSGTPGIGMYSAGASAMEFATEQYAAVPLVSGDTVSANIIDYASEIADDDVMPARATSMALSDFETAQLEGSLNALSNLHDELKDRGSDEKGHAVAYILPFNSLVNNPLAVQHFCRQISKNAIAGVVDSLLIRGLAHTPSGHEVARHVTVNAVVAI